MVRTLAKAEKPLHWVGSSKSDFLAFPAPIRDHLSNALGLAQLGGKHPSAKPWKGQGSGFFQIVTDHDGSTYRTVYTVRFTDLVYVLHAVEEKPPAADPNGAPSTKTGAAGA
jgi:phage-related protein